MLKMTCKGSSRVSLQFCRTMIKSTSMSSSTSSSKSSTRFNHSKARFQISFTSLRNRQLNVLEQEKQMRCKNSKTSELKIRRSWALVTNKCFGNILKKRMVSRDQIKVLKAKSMKKVLRSPESVVRCQLQQKQWSRRISRRSSMVLDWTHSEYEMMTTRA